MHDNETIEILNTKISRFGIEELSKYINDAVNYNKKTAITYAHFHTLNNNADKKEINGYYRIFDVIHADGIGVYLASHFLYGKDGLKKRITGSDFYPIFIQDAIKNKWKIFFFGDSDDVLTRIPQKHKNLNIVGTQNGYNFNTDKLINQINSAEPDILVVGIGGPNQEKWICENINSLKTKVIIAVGEGIKVFAGFRHRGPRIIRTLGMEWIVRLLYAPYLWKRYIWGIPLFCGRVFNAKRTRKKNA